MLSGSNSFEDEPTGDFSAMTSAPMGLSLPAVSAPVLQAIDASDAHRGLEESMFRHSEIARLEGVYREIRALKDDVETKLKRAISEKNKAIGRVQRLEELQKSSGFKTISAMQHLTNGDASNATTTAKILNTLPVSIAPQIGQQLRFARIDLADAEKIVIGLKETKIDLLKQMIMPIEQTLVLHRQIIGKDLERFICVTAEMDETVQEVIALDLPLGSSSEIHRMVDLRDKIQKTEERESLTTTVSSWFMRTMRLA